MLRLIMVIMLILFISCSSNTYKINKSISNTLDSLHKNHFFSQSK